MKKNDILMALMESNNKLLVARIEQQESKVKELEQEVKRLNLALIAPKQAHGTSGIDSTISEMMKACGLKLEDE